MAKTISKIKEKEKRVKKSPNDYPKFAFRIDSESKKEISEWVDSIYYAYQDRKDQRNIAIKRNDIILDALRIGLKAIEDKITSKEVRKKNLTLAEWQKRNKKDKPKNALF